MSHDSQNTQSPRLTAVGRYIELYQEHCATMPLLNNQECAVIERLAEWAKERCPFPICDDDGSISDCIAKGHCGCNESGRNDRDLSDSLPFIDRSDAVNLARNVLAQRADPPITTKGIIALAEAVLDLDAYITRHSAIKELSK